eukprot:TRINITY_DN9263_c0_g1_i3.p1 TRINITY_DN9263_c0_g1~~TRINITY_DN9263_c0_g1_i3.p1  ORF type:complete len:1296 (+),score=312.80 TRINITY_DN9263_c0_g1_i3:80-3889(+)
MAEAEHPQLLPGLSAAGEIDKQLRYTQGLVREKAAPRTATATSLGSEWSATAETQVPVAPLPLPDAQPGSPPPPSKPLWLASGLGGMAPSGANPLMSPGFCQLEDSVRSTSARLPTGPFGGACDQGFGVRLGHGLDGCGHAGTEGRADDMQHQMRERTRYRANYPAEDDWAPGAFDWVLALPRLFREWFTPEERGELGVVYNPYAPHCLEFYDEDMIQPAEERLPCGGCRPRTPLRVCGIHGERDLLNCAKRPECISAGETQGAATCLLDNWSRIGGRVAAALRGQQPALEAARISAELAEALGRMDPAEAAEGISGTFLYSYEIKAPPGAAGADADGSRPTQLYRLLGCALRSLGDPAMRAKLSPRQRVLCEGVVELLRPFQWRLDKFLLGLPHRPCVVYRGINLQVAKNYDVGSIVLWPPVTSTSRSREVAWSFMSASGAGTFWTILAQSVAAISPFSWLAGEEEWLLHSLSVHKVSTKMHPGLRAAIRTNHDMVTVIQADGRGGCLGLHETVDSRTLTWVEVTRFFDDFLSTYVPPAVAVVPSAAPTSGLGGGAGDVESAPHGVELGAGLVSSGGGGERDLLTVAREWSASDSRTALLIGDSGSGKSASALRLLRAATQEADPLPRPPGCGGSWAPLYVALPTVRRLLGPGTGTGTGCLPLADYIAAMAHLSPEEVAELRTRPLLIVLDGLEEVPADPSHLRRRGLLGAGGLDLAEWSNAKVIVCIRREMLEQPRGFMCSRWRLMCDDVLPGAAVWNIQPFGEAQIDAFCRAVVDNELRQLALRLSAPPDPSDDAEEEALRSALAAVRCTPPPLACARELRAAARGLAASVAGPQGLMEAASRSEAGTACSAAMLPATADVVARVRAADPALVASPFILSMVVAVGRELSGVDLHGGARQAVYGSWAAAEVRQRLPRLGQLAADCPKFAAMGEEERVQLVLGFCAKLATSPAMIEVPPSMVLYATLHCYASISRIAHLELSPLGAEHNRALLEAAPVRVEEGEDGLVSFVHASVHDYFVASRVIAALEQDGGMADPDVQRVAVVSGGQPSLEAAVIDAAGADGGRIIHHLRHRVYAYRLCLAVMIVVYWVSTLGTHFTGVSDWHHWLGFAAYTVLGLQLFVPRATVAARQLQWSHVLGILVFLGFTVKTIRTAQLCELDRLHQDDTMDFLCKYGPYSFIAMLPFYFLPFTFVLCYPQFIVASVVGVNIFTWPSATFRRLFILAHLLCAAYYGFAVAYADRLRHVVAPAIFLFLALRTQRLPARVRA